MSSNARLFLFEERSEGVSLVCSGRISSARMTSSRKHKPKAKVASGAV